MEDVAQRVYYLLSKHLSRNIKTVQTLVKNPSYSQVTSFSDREAVRGTGVKSSLCKKKVLKYQRCNTVETLNFYETYILCVALSPLRIPFLTTSMVSDVTHNKQNLAVLSKHSMIKISREKQRRNFSLPHLVW